MRLSFNYREETIEFDVIYRKRKTLSIKVEAPGIITVHAPEGAKSEAIISIVLSRGEWILRKVAEVKAREKLKIQHEYLNGEDFQYLGLRYALQIIINETTKNPCIWLEEDLIYIRINEDNPVRIRDCLEKWYRKEANEKILERIKHYEPYVGISPNKVTIKEQKKRWGSCSSKGELFFNWRIVMAPLEILDYVVVHEMCHLIHFDHSVSFWKLVESIIPDHKKRREWLREKGVILNL